MYALTHAVLRSLHEDHLKTLGLLDRLESLLRRGADDPPAADDAESMALVDEVVANMRDEVSNHFSFEEEQLFTRFSRVAEPGIPMMLQGEHDALRALARNMDGLWAKAKDGGFDAATWAAFHRLGRELVEREVFHIQKEEMGFLPAMDQILQPDEADDLTRLYRAGSSGG